MWKSASAATQTWWAPEPGRDGSAPSPERRLSSVRSLYSRVSQGVEEDHAGEECFFRVLTERKADPQG